MTGSSGVPLNAIETISFLDGVSRSPRDVKFAPPTAHDLFRSFRINRNPRGSVRFRENITRARHQIFWVGKKFVYLHGTFNKSEEEGKLYLSANNRKMNYKRGRRVESRSKFNTQHFAVIKSARGPTKAEEPAGVRRKQKTRIGEQLDEEPEQVRGPVAGVLLSVCS